MFKPPYTIRTLYNVQWTEHTIIIIVIRNEI